MLFQPRGSSRRAVSRLRPSRLGLRLYPAGSPRLKTESSSSRTDRSFASRCSPPRLTATQLRSALVNEHLTRQDFHLSDRVRSRAHWVGRPRPKREAVPAERRCANSDACVLIVPTAGAVGTFGPGGPTHMLWPGDSHCGRATLIVAGRLSLSPGVRASTPDARGRPRPSVCAHSDALARRKSRPTSARPENARACRGMHENAGLAAGVHSCSMIR
jgi:hypothetical protein